MLIIFNISLIRSKTFEYITIKVIRHDVPITKIRADTVNDEKNATEVMIEEENVPVLKSGSFQDLPDLQYVHVVRNNIEVIEEYAFEDLPSLRTINLNLNIIQNITKNVFANLTVEKISLKGNGISKLEPWSFYNLTFLRYLDLSSNNIRNLPVELFVMTRNLKVLDLSWNHLKTHLGARSMSSFTYFEEPFWNIDKHDDSLINLSFNQIDHIDRRMFEGLIGIKKILLNYNIIKIIHDHAFEKMVFLEEIDLEGNNLESLSIPVLETFLMVTDIHLSNNPWRNGFVCRYDEWCNKFNKTNTMDGNCTFSN